MRTGSTKRVTCPTATTPSWWRGTRPGWPRWKRSWPHWAPAPAAPEAPERATGPERPPLPRWRRIGIVASCLLIAAGAVILVVHFVQARQPGQSSSGGVTLSQAQTIEQQLRQAVILNNQGQTKAALELYNEVLTEDPSNPAALAYAGYLQWNIGSAAHVAELVEDRARRDRDLGQGLAHLLRGPSVLWPRPREPGSRQRVRPSPSSTTSWPTARPPPSCPRWRPSSRAPTRPRGSRCPRRSRPGRPGRGLSPVATPGRARPG